MGAIDDRPWFHCESIEDYGNKGAEPFSRHAVGDMSHSRESMFRR